MGAPAILGEQKLMHMAEDDAELSVCEVRPIHV